MVIGPKKKRNPWPTLTKGCPWWAVGPWLRVFPCSFDPKSLHFFLLFNPPSLYKSSIIILHSFSLLHWIHPSFFLKSPNSFLFLHFFHKFSIFRLNLHPNCSLSSYFFHLQSPPHFSSSNSSFLFFKIFPSSFIFHLLPKFLQNFHLLSKIFGFPLSLNLSM